MMSNVLVRWGRGMFAVLLGLAMCVGGWAIGCPGAAWADEQQQHLPQQQDVQGSGSWVSPWDSGKVKLRSGQRAAIPDVSKNQEHRPVITSIGELQQFMHTNMHYRTPVFTVTYRADTSNLEYEIKDILDNIMKNDTYLQQSISSYGFSYKGYVNNVDVEFEMSYRSTWEQEQAVEEKVNQILDSILRPDMNKYAQVKSAHDYIVANVAYDESIEEFTAYAALFKGKAVCQGYALLAHKMFTRAGIETMIVQGTANDINHAWNLVRIEGRWFHVDTTWDDPLPDRPGRVLYDYFMLTDDQLSKSHNWERNEYPAAHTVYDRAWADETIHEDPTAPPNKIWPEQTLTEDKQDWMIAFNQPLDPATVQMSNIYIQDAHGLCVDTKPQLMSDQHKVLIKAPVGGYLADSNMYYVLCIQKEVRSARGTALKQGVEMKFRMR